jgi:hypothetical protein
MENNNLIEYKIQGSCTCGNVKYVNTNEKKTLKDIWGIFICHCSQCPIQSKTWKDERLQSVGTPWIAIPRSSFSSINQSLKIENLSTFAERGSCKQCGDSMYIRYNCEKNTDWVHLKTFNAKLDLKSPPLLKFSNDDNYSKHIIYQHIHCNIKSTTNNLKLIDSKGIPIFHNEGLWEPDPCREHGFPVPKVCSTCWQLIETGECIC